MASLQLFPRRQPSDFGCPGQMVGPCAMPRVFSRQSGIRNDAACEVDFWWWLAKGAADPAMLVRAHPHRNSIRGSRCCRALRCCRISKTRSARGARRDRGHAVARRHLPPRRLPCLPPERVSASAASVPTPPPARRRRRRSARAPARRWCRDLAAVARRRAHVDPSAVAVRARARRRRRGSRDRRARDRLDAALARRAARGGACIVDAPSALGDRP